MSLTLCFKTSRLGIESELFGFLFSRSQLRQHCTVPKWTASCLDCSCSWRFRWPLVFLTARRSQTIISMLIVSRERREWFLKSKKETSAGRKAAILLLERRSSSGSWWRCHIRGLPLGTELCWWQNQESESHHRGQLNSLPGKGDGNLSFSQPI